MATGTLAMRPVEWIQDNPPTLTPTVQAMSTSSADHGGSRWDRDGDRYHGATEPREGWGDSFGNAPRDRPFDDARGRPFDGSQDKPWGFEGDRLRSAGDDRYEFRPNGASDSWEGSTRYRFRGDPLSGQGDRLPPNDEGQYHFRPLSEKEKARHEANALLETAGLKYPTSTIIDH